MVNFDRNVFAASMVRAGHADAMITGVTRNYSVALDAVRHVLDPKAGQRIIGVSIILARGRIAFVADTNVHDMPTSEELADITVMAAGWRGASATNRARRPPIRRSAIRAANVPSA